jgi:hypothetical protein
MVRLTSRGADCCEGCAESCSIFLFDSRKIGQSLVQWLVALPWYMQYGGSMLHLFGCPVRIFGQKFSDVPLAKLFQNSSPNFLAGRSHQNQCCVLAWGSFNYFHCSKVLGLCWALTLSSGAQAYGNVGPRTC